ncbi:MAG: Nif3-like dinuclear metal center hexameric protein [Actinomycetaceae bacterium]|nr:Nif3-like dinuclear metal center hexameric protein [Actinomycetaceae bacterium]
MSLKIADAVAVMEGHFPAALKEEWDRVGLIVGNPDAELRTVGFAVDPCEATIREAIDRGADLLITHHPLYLRGTSTVADVGGKGSWVHELIRGGCALFAAHTNADAAQEGSATALANLLGLVDQRPLDPHPSDSELGIGKIGRLPITMSVRELAQRVKAVIPETPDGVLIGGDPERIVSLVALSPGSGDSYLDAVADSEADVYITADLRHHPATDHLWAGECPLISVTHFASEWPVLLSMRDAIASELSVRTYVSTIVTDPWVERV